MATKKTEEVITLNIPALDIRTIRIHVVGDSPLIMHNWSEKAKKEMLDKEMGVAKSKKHDIRDPFREFIESIYWLSNEPEEKTPEGFEKAIEAGATFGFPSVAIKAAAIAAGYRCGVLPNQVIAKGAIHITGEFIPITGSVPTIREDMVRLGGITRAADLRYRGEFTNWESTFDVSYNAGVFTAEQVVNLFNLGGYACGLGEWRVEKDGDFGRFHCE